MGKLHEQSFAIRVFAGGKVFPLQLRFNRVHHHARLKGVDPEIVVPFKAGVADRLFGRELRLLCRHFAAAGLLHIVIDDAPGRFDRALDDFIFAFFQVELQLGIDKADGAAEGENNEAAESEDFFGHFHVVEHFKHG